MKHAFYMDQGLYEHMRGTFLGLGLCMPTSRYVECAKLLATLHTEYSPGTGKKFEIDQEQFDCLFDSLTHHYNSLMSFADDKDTDAEFRESYLNDAKRLLWIAKALLEQGKENGLAKSGAFAGKKIC